MGWGSGCAAEDTGGEAGVQFNMAPGVTDVATLGGPRKPS